MKQQTIRESTVRTGEEIVTLEQARERLIAWAENKNPGELWRPSMLAEVIWPNNRFLSPQGAARAAGGVLRKLGLSMDYRGKYDSGYRLGPLLRESIKKG